MPRKLIVLLTTFLLSSLIISAQENGRVIEMWGFLNVRAEPSRTAEIVAELAGQTPVTATGRSAGNNWLQILTPDGGEGWVAASFIDLVGDINTLPVIESTITNTTSATTTTTDSADSTAATASTTTTTSATVTGAAAGNARVIAGILNLRSAPSQAGEILAALSYDTLVSLYSRSADGQWVQVSTSSGLVGWVAARYLNPNTPISNLPIGEAAVVVTGEDGEVSAAVAAAPVAVSEIITLGSSTRSIYLSGQQQGNRRNVFSKVGDSITFNPLFLSTIGTGNYNLGSHPNLAPTINFFSAATARTSNSFANESLAARGGFTSENVLNPQFANPDVCAPEESPLACEYRLTRPAVALIMFGTNDVQFYPIGEYAYYMRQIIEYSIDQGVIPVLSTIPARNGYDGLVNEFNNLIISFAQEYGVPLWDYHLAMTGLPNFGLSGDGTHPSEPPEGLNNAANLQFPYLNYGYVMRNLTALQVLDALRVNVLGG